MLNLSPELESLRSTLGDAKTNTLLARERREVFSLHPELRIVSWGGAMLLAAAAGIVLKNNLERIGPLVLALLMAAAAAACYAWVWMRRSRASLVDDYILLLGALLLSADVAFIENQFHLFDEHWSRHLLIVAAVHAAAAYAYRSRTLLSLAVVAMAGWLGATGTAVFSTLDAPDYAPRAFAAVAFVLLWRAANRVPEFAATLEHFAANFAFAGAFSLMFAYDTRIVGCLLALLVAAAVVAWGMKTRREAFVLYSFIYAVVAADVLIIELLDADEAAFFVVFVSVFVAIAGLIALHGRLREDA